MTADPIYRVRRLALAARLCAGGQPSADDYRRAALEPFDARVPFAHAVPADAPGAAAASIDTPGRKPGPAF